MCNAQMTAVNMAMEGILTALPTRLRGDFETARADRVVTLAILLAFLDDYAKLTNSELAAENAKKLSVPYAPTQDFEDFLRMHQTVHKTFRRSETALSELQKMNTSRPRQSRRKHSESIQIEAIATQAWP